MYLNQHTRLVEQKQDERRRAIRYLASSALDAEDCAHLLRALGLKPEEGLRKEVPEE